MPVMFPTPIIARGEGGDIYTALGIASISLDSNKTSMLGAQIIVVNRFGEMLTVPAVGLDLSAVKMQAREAIK